MAPLLSVLLPTRNRLRYLREAIETVRRQDDGDWELVVSDNDSQEDVEGHVRGLRDARVHYVRTASFVPVTDNWNSALAHSRGRYVVMLGDDDGLMPGFVAAIRALAQRFGEPDVIHQSAWLLTHPGVDPAAPQGFLKPYGYSSFQRGAREPFVLDPRTARRMVALALRFRIRYGFNMQFATISRALVRRLAPQGPFFQSAFPDYYAMNAAFLTARTIVVTPQPLVTIGVTPRSYGFFHLNADERAGKAFLEAAAERARPDPPALAPRPADMPGTNINAGWLSALEALHARYGALLPADPDMRRYRLLQALHVYERHLLDGTAAADEVAALARHMPRWERLRARGLVEARRVIAPRLPRIVRRALHGVLQGVLLAQFVNWDPPAVDGRYATLLDVFDDPPAPPPVARGPLRQRLRRTSV